MKKWRIDPVTCLCILILAILLAIAITMPGTGQSGSTVAGNYEVLLPEGYEDSDAEYPVVYVLPQDGYAIDDSGIAEKLQAAMGDKVIIVKVSFDKDEDVSSALQSVVYEITHSYRTIAKADHRVLMGTGTGGYLAYILGITESDMYKLMVSIRGDFVSEENPWYETYGDVYGKVDWGSDDSFEKLYTYLDAPVDDKWTDMKGSTNDLGARFIKHGTSSSAHEFTVRPGEFTEEFLTESVNRAADRLITRFYPEEEEASEGQPESAAASLEDIEGEILIDLTSDWYFKYVGTKKLMDVKALTAEEYETWPVVQPGTGNWTKGYGNISEENVSSSYGADYFDYFIVGSGYYVKTFDMPEEIDHTELVLAIGYVDDRCEVFLNGERIGATGMDQGGNSTGETTWSEYSEFVVEPELLKETNTVVVRAWNDEPYGAGGWYSGPIALYSKASGGETEEVSKEELRFFEETFESKYAASALGESGIIENDYLIYLPEGYYESDRYYPTVYLLHQFNSNHNSYKTDDVDKLLDEGIASGAFDEMIVVIPNSDENSWWTGDWEKMITEELIPLIDSKYRTIDDARFRLTAGCSMGGQGAYGVALHNPDYFSAAVSFFGAFSYGEGNSPNTISTQESAEYLDYFSMYFICGNQDSYGFGVPAIELHQILSEKEVAHRFFIENGGHDSAFYVPYFNDAFGYIRGEMYQSDEAVESMLTGTLTVDDTKVKADVEAVDGIEEYFNAIPESSYTEETVQGLNIPLILEVIQDGEVVYEIVNRDFVVNEEINSTTVLVDVADCVDTSKEFTVQFKAAVFDKVVSLGLVEK